MSIEQTLAERQNTHGDFSDNARVSQALKDVLVTGPYYEALTPVQREALHMIAHKMSRIVAGNPNHTDHWHDIAGYAKLVEERLSHNAQGIDVPLGASGTGPAFYRNTFTAYVTPNTNATQTTPEGMYPLNKPRETPLPVPEDQHPV